MELTLHVSDELAERLKPWRDEMAQLLETGLRDREARSAGEFANFADVLETLAALPTPEDVLKMRPSPGLQSRIDELLEKSRTAGLDANEEREWQEFEYLEHLVRIAKGRARQRLGAGES